MESCPSMALTAVVWYEFHHEGTFYPCLTDYARQEGLTVPS